MVFLIISKICEEFWAIRHFIFKVNFKHWRFNNLYQEIKEHIISQSYHNLIKTFRSLLEVLINNKECSNMFKSISSNCLNVFFTAYYEF